MLIRLTPGIRFCKRRRSPSTFPCGSCFGGLGRGPKFACCRRAERRIPRRFWTRSNG
ncbi:hypothetical protein ABWV16_22890, partial [Bacillus velezensis]|uniref:hypothetical protein n=1 Tax=Bacillus velezensis TaxID=492670 RepID=UPI0033954B12